jgi:hypothetical protein
MHTGFSFKNLKKRDCLQDLGGDKEIILKWVLKKEDVRM